MGIHDPMKHADGVAGRGREATTNRLPLTRHRNHADPYRSIAARDQPIAPDYGYSNCSSAARRDFANPSPRGVRTGDLADPELGDFHHPEGFTILPELNPVPGDIAIAVSDHGIAAC
jgi:hypothetical protein